MKNELLKKVGNISQIAGMRPIQINEGKGKGTQAVEVYNRAGLRFTVLTDQCLDIYDFSYKGINFSFQAKTGLVGNQFFNALDNEFLYYWPAGMMYTCGLANTGPSCTDGGYYRTEHGRIGMIPAENVCKKADWQDDEFLMTVSGEMTESMIYGSALKLKREIKTKLDAKEVSIKDTVVNLEPNAEELMMLYHFNFGYPLIDDATRVIMPKSDVYPRTPEAERNIDSCFETTPPIDNAEEQVFIHSNIQDDEGFAYVGVINRELQLGAYIKYTLSTLPLLVQWKSMRSHDYTLGLEPSNSNILGRDEERKNGSLKVVDGYGEIDYKVVLGVLDGKEEIDCFVDKIKNMK